MKVLRSIVAAMFVCFLNIPGTQAHADGSSSPAFDAGSGQDVIWVQATASTRARRQPAGGIALQGSVGESQPQYVQFRWVSVCAGSGPTAAAGQSADCGQANTCP